MAETVESRLKHLGFVSDGGLTDTGREALAVLLNFLPPVHRGIWGPVFLPLMSRCVPASIELIIIENGRILLTYREDAHYKGYLTPGTYIGPGESWLDAANRCAERELGVSVTDARYLTSFNKPDSPPFHDVSNLVLCTLADHPQKTAKSRFEWFKGRPRNLIPEQERFWPVIERYLTKDWE